MLGCILVCVTVFLIILILKRLHWFGKLKNISSKHVVITGGSSGIGLSAAKEVARRGANVTIIARDMTKLENAKLEILKCCTNENQKINTVSANVIDADDIQKAIRNSEHSFGPIFMLINCAGMAICGKLEDMSVVDIRYLMDLNFMGTIFATQAVVSQMKSRGEGIIVLTSSQAGLIGLYGYSAYSSSKFALRGLAEALHMETKMYNVSVTIALPPDTDTPGFANEEKSKPIETRLISESGGLLSPDDVGRQLVKDALGGRFYSYIGLESFILSTLCVGMCPVTSISDLFIEFILMGPLRIISAIYLNSFYKIIESCKSKNDKKNK